MQKTETSFLPCHMIPLSHFWWPQRQMASRPFVLTLPPSVPHHPVDRVGPIHLPDGSWVCLQRQMLTSGGH